MAAELKDKFSAEIELIGAGGGIFDVVADGELIFSKHQEGNEFPQHPEVVSRLEKFKSTEA